MYIVAYKLVLFSFFKKGRICVQVRDDRSANTVVRFFDDDDAIRDVTLR